MNGNISPLITVGITAFNEGDLLQEAWDSVKNQTSSHFKTIMMLDGGATIETAYIFNNINSPNLLKFKEKDNRGPYWCRSKVIEKCETEWYFHLDGDDRLPLDIIELLNNYINNNPGLDFIWGKCLFFNEEEYFVQFVEDIDPDKQAWGNQILGTSPIKKHMFQELNGFHKPLYNGGADWEFWTRVISNGYKGKFINNIIYERRRREGNVGDKWLLNRDKVAKIIIENNPETFKKNGRKENCLGRAYELISRRYRSKGNRKQAAIYAESANAIGWKFKAMEEIIKENKMSKIRYAIRRFFLFIPKKWDFFLFL